jgi:hypothetical protein
MVLRSQTWRLGSKLNIVSVVRSLSVLLVLLGSAFTVCAIYLIPHKAPWVDEMYTWYGIHHDNFGQFWDSIGSGINYSPPLYFFLNWILQLFLPLSLNALRVESLLWILGGTVLVYLTLRKQLGSPTALLGVGCVLLQSSLLFGQSLEARSYGLFFFCGAAVLYTGQSLTIDKGKRSTWAWAFIAHLALCLTHYLGIVFSGLAALSRYLSIGKRRNRALWTSPEIASWIVSLPVYGYLINSQSSHLAAWPRPNGLQDLLASYLDSINPLFFTIPIILTLFLNPTSKKEKNLRGTEDNNKFILWASILWISIPTLIWLLSHVTPLNLFKDRYFMPKEAAWMVLIALFIARVPFFQSNSRKTLFPMGVSILLGVSMLTLSTQRQLFALHPSRNYYHWLIADDEIFQEGIPIVFSGDPVFFPNDYLFSGENYFLIDEEERNQLYKKFSKKIRVVEIDQIKRLNQLIIIDKDSQIENAFSKTHSRKHLGKLHEQLGLQVILLEKVLK